MATVAVNLTRATSHRLKYTVDGSATGAGTLNVTQAAMIAATVPGPLRDALASAAAGSGAWESLLTGQTFGGQEFAGQIGCVINQGDGAALSTIFGASFLAGAPNVMVVSVGGAPAGTVTAFMDIFFIHSIVF